MSDRDWRPCKPLLPKRLETGERSDGRDGGWLMRRRVGTRWGAVPITAYRYMTAEESWTFQWTPILRPSWPFCALFRGPRLIDGTYDDRRNGGNLMVHHGRDGQRHFRHLTDAERRDDIDAMMNW